MQLWIGLIAGAGIVGLTVLYLARTRMVQVHRVGASFDDTCRMFSEALAESDKWGQPLPEWDMHAAMAEKGQVLENTRRIKMFFVCKAPYAGRILGKRPEMASMMPCSWTVYERNDGQVYIAKLNIGMMSKAFTGNIVGSVMGRVAREEHSILSRLPVQQGG